MLTLGSAALLPPSLLCVTLATHGIDKLVGRIGTAAISALLVAALIFRDGHRYTLLLQSSYYVVFFATVLFVAYS